MAKEKKEDLTCPFHEDVECTVGKILKKIDLLVYLMLIMCASQGIEFAKWLLKLMK